MRTITTQLRPVALAIAFALALLWPAAINGGPFWFPDTTNYIRSADAALVMVTGDRTEWSDRIVERRPNNAEAASAHSERGASARTAASSSPRLVPTRPVLAGRSIYYGFLLYLPMLLAGPWAAALMQALVVSGVLTFCTVLVGRTVRLSPLWIGGVAAILLFATPLPFYTGMLMPDVYSGLIVLVVGIAAVLWHRLSNLERVTLVALAGAIASFHTSHVLILGSIVLAALALSPFIGRWRGAAVIGAGGVAIAALAMTGFNVAVERTLGDPPMSPPFLSARLTDGPAGIEYLDRHCRSDPTAFTLCRHRDRLPLDSNYFLWSKNEENGLFQLLPIEEQHALVTEDRRFFFAVLLDDPTSFVSVAAQAALELLTNFDLENYNYSDQLKRGIMDQYPPSIAPSVADSRAADGTMPVDATVALSIASTAAAAVLLLGLGIGWAGGRLAIDREAGWLCVLLVLGVLANAAICGALSGPHARYQMRLIWLLPYAAMVGVAAFTYAAGATARRAEAGAAA